MPSKTGSELFLVDNSDSDWKVLRYLNEWYQIAKGIDIATGCFEIGSLLALNGEWQKVDGIRILMGDEISLRTKKVFTEGLKRIDTRLDDSLESEKAKNDFLQGYLHASDRPKQLFFLTATPINNSVHDFRHMLELFTNGVEHYFARNLGIHSVRAHFVHLEKRILGIRPRQDAAQMNLELGTEILEAEQALRIDKLFEELVVQRSRAYVKESQAQQGANEALFPERSAPKIIPYNLKATYGRLLESIERAFNKEQPLFVLSIYYPSAHWKGDKESPRLQEMGRGPPETGRHPDPHALPQALRKLLQGLRGLLLASPPAHSRMGSGPRRIRPRQGPARPLAIPPRRPVRLCPRTPAGVLARQFQSGARARGGRAGGFPHRGHPQLY